MEHLPDFLIMVAGATVIGALAGLLAVALTIRREG